MEGRLAREIQPPPVEPKVLGAQAVPKAPEIGLSLVQVGSPAVRKFQMAPPVAEIEIQAKPLNSGGNKGNAQGSQGKGKGNPSGAFS